ncbi:MAG: argininosuccinate lyase [Opitutales bacterium]
MGAAKKSAKEEKDGAEKKSMGGSKTPFKRARTGKTRAPFAGGAEGGVHLSQATWGGRFAEGPTALMQRFSESVSFDARLARHDVAGSKAHAAMLAHCGLIQAKEREAIQKGLDEVLAAIEADEFAWDPALEDVHMNIEQALLQITPAAAKLHTARSRNDQVATDMRLFLKEACAQLDQALVAVKSSLLTTAEANQAMLIPGYTHLQRAQPVSAAHHLLAYVEMFDRDRRRFAVVADHANWCPLGSGALAGTTLRIDREFTATALGFVDAEGVPRLTRNSMDAVSDRDVYVEFVNACALCGVHFSRLAEDLILWNSAEFNFVRLPEGLTTGSSLMPQKKNPDSLELIRGKAARLHGQVSTLLTLMKGLPLTYNRDLQEDKRPVFDALDTTLDCLLVLAECVGGLEFNRGPCGAAVADPWLLATDLVDYLVEKGVPFREAHHRIGKLVALAEKEKQPLDNLMLSQVQAIDERFEADWIKVFQKERALQRREQVGMPGPQAVAGEIQRWKSLLAQID